MRITNNDADKRKCRREFGLRHLCRVGVVLVAPTRFDGERAAQLHAMEVELRSGVALVPSRVADDFAPMVRGGEVVSRRGAWLVGEWRAWLL